MMGRVWVSFVWMWEGNVACTIGYSIVWWDRTGKGMSMGWLCSMLCGKEWLS